MTLSASQVLRLAGILALVGVAPGAASALCMARPIRAPEYYKAHEAFREGNHADARRLFYLAEKNPGDAARWMAGAFTGAGHQAQAQGQHEQARSHFRAALNEDRTNWAAGYAIVASYEKQERFHDALQAIHSFPKALAKNPAMVRIEATILEKLGDVGGARKLTDEVAKKSAAADKIQR